MAWTIMCTSMQGQPDQRCTSCSRNTIRRIMSWRRPLLPPGKADLIPVELLSEMFLLIVQHRPWCRKKLMLVCRRWHAIILSTPGIHSQLTIGRATQKDVAQAFILGRKSRLHVRVDMSDEKDGSDFNPETFYACFMAAAQAAPRWSSLDLISPPPHGEYKARQILQPLVHLESLKLACGFGEFLEPLMTAISRGASPKLTTIHLEDPAAVLYLVQPACLHITHSLTTFIVHLSKRMGSPVDILPHLHRLNVFDARNLCLPFYLPDTCLPFTHTLRFLDLKSVSVQWMAGHVFPALEHCDIKFPRHVDIIQALQPVTMPSCIYFRYHSNDLHPLAQFHLPSLRELDVKCGQWNVWRGNPHLAALCPVVAAGAIRLVDLRLDIECSEQLLVYMLSLVPRLEWLQLGLARPNALSTTFFQAFIVREPNADGASDMVGPPNQTITPLCPSLKSLQLHYKRWLRGPDKKALIVVLGGIVQSRQPEEESSFSLTLSFETFGTIWTIDKPVRESQELEPKDIILGISVPYGMVPISAREIPWELTSVPLPFKEAEYLQLRPISFPFSFEFFFVHDHMELVVLDRPLLPTPLPCAFPLFYALRVLVIEGAKHSFFAGHTFHKLERCRVTKSRKSFGSSPSLVTEAEMPVCTRVDIDDPYILATFKLPQIYELALKFSDPDSSTIWEKRIAVNANLSGLNLLHMKRWPFDGDLIPILRYLPLLETLITSTRLGVVSFRAFLPMEANGTSGLKGTSGEGLTLALLCPRLKYIWIEGQDPSVEPELIPILKDIVTLRAMYGSPLKKFTFFDFWPKPGSKTELIGRDQSFTMGACVLEEEEFELDI